MTNSRKFFGNAVFALAVIALLAVPACDSEKVAQAEAKADQAEKNAMELAAKLTASVNDLAKLKERVNGLEAKASAAEDRAKKAEALVVAKAESPKETVVNVTATKPAAVADKPVPAKTSEADAIRVHSLAGADQIAAESEEMAPALKSCDKDGKLGLGICVLPKQTQYSAWFPILVTWKDDTVSTDVEKRNLLGCLQRQATVKRDKAKTSKNAAELVVRSSFTGECIGVQTP